MEKLFGKIEVLKDEHRVIEFDVIENCVCELHEGAKLELKGRLIDPVGCSALTVEFVGRGAELSFDTVLVSQHDSDFELKLLSEHNARGTKADYRLRSALYDKSRVIFLGNVKIPLAGQHSDVHFEHHSLLFSDQVRVRTIPSMEIVASDVKATHAATIGKLDEEMLFYLATRGFSEKQAEQMVVESFLA